MSYTQQLFDSLRRNQASSEGLFGSVDAGTPHAARSRAALAATPAPNAAAEEQKALIAQLRARGDSLQELADQVRAPSAAHLSPTRFPFPP